MIEINDEKNMIIKKQERWRNTSDFKWIRNFQNISRLLGIISVKNLLKK